VKQRHMLVLLAPLGSVLLFGAFFLSHTFVTTAADLMDTGPKVADVEFMVTAWTGVAGAVLFCVGMFFVCTTPVAFRKYFHLLSAIGFLMGTLLIGLANAQLFLTFYRLASAQIFGPRMMRESIGTSGDVILAGFVSIVIACGCACAAVPWTRQPGMRRRRGLASRIVLATSPLFLVSGICWLSDLSLAFASIVNRPGLVEPVDVAGCVSCVFLATFIALLGVAGFGILALLSHRTTAAAS
jgi:hypothetical protein